MSGNAKINHILRRFGQHRDLPALETLLPHLRKMQKLASQHGIHDVFQDNGGKLLQVLLVTGLKKIPGREGNDAVDADGNQYELKSVNRFDTRGQLRSSPSFTTHHHLNPTIIKKYRRVDWIFAIYSGIELEEVYVMTPSHLEPYYRRWEADYRTKGDLNNPKISLSFVQQNGIKLYPSLHAPTADDSGVANALRNPQPHPRKKRKPKEA